MNSNKINRTEGQLWIDRTSPFNLRYHVNNTDFNLAPTATYTYEDSDSSQVGDLILSAGTVVKFVGNNKLKKAVFPDDLENVLGVTTADLIKGNGFDLPITVAQDGYVIIEHPEKVFATEKDLLFGETGNKYSDENKIIGKPVYWFIGRIEKSGESYNYISTDQKAGLLTFATPSGFEGEGNTVTDDSLNVGYDNLPQIGSVANVEVSSEVGFKKITKIKIHLNFSKFDSSLEWNWPRVHDSSTDCGKIECGFEGNPKKVKPAEIIVRHGLFPSAASRTSRKYMARCFVDITANPLKIKEPSEESSINYDIEYNVSTDIHNEYNTLEDPKTIIYIKHPEPMFYRISGRINYKFDKNHQPLI